jgi:hypothetical protein
LPAKDPFPLAIHHRRSAISGHSSVEEIEGVGFHMQLIWRFPEFPGSADSFPGSCRRLPGYPRYGKFSRKLLI